MDAGIRAFRLEIDSSATPLRGRLAPDARGDEEGAIGFTGWTGLAAALERLLDGEDSSSSDENQTQMKRGRE